eukprot:7343664-Alexandrium_andersonii.AAC.1
MLRASRAPTFWWPARWANRSEGRAGPWGPSPVRSGVPGATRGPMPSVTSGHRPVGLRKWGPL